MCTSEVTVLSCRDMKSDVDAIEPKPDPREPKAKAKDMVCELHKRMITPGENRGQT